MALRFWSNVHLHSSSFAFKFFSLLFSHTSLRTFLGFGPLDEAGSSLLLSSDDMKSMAFGEQKISLAFSLSLSYKIAFSKLERRLDSFLFNRFCCFIWLRCSSNFLFVFLVLSSRRDFQYWWTALLMTAFVHLSLLYTERTSFSTLLAIVLFSGLLKLTLKSKLNWFSWSSSCPSPFVSSLHTFLTAFLYFVK